MGWFRDLTGLDADDPAMVHASIRVEGENLVSAINGRRMRAGALSTPSLAGLRKQTVHLETGRGLLRLAETVGDVRALHADPVNAGAVFQVASQFNLLEMVDPGVTPEEGIARYEYDLTQGPACAIACGAGTIWRNYFVPIAGGVGQTRTRQVDCLADLGQALGNEGARLWEMRNGYALPTARGLMTVSQELSRLGAAGQDELMGKLRVGVQSGTEVTFQNAGHPVSQIFCSALPVAYGGHEPEDWEPFASLILDAAYEATFRAALAERQAGGIGRVFLTLLGGGAFGNRSDWIAGAILRALAQFSDSGLDVRLVSHGASDLRVANILERATSLEIGVA